MSKQIIKRLIAKMLFVFILSGLAFTLHKNDVEYIFAQKYRDLKIESNLVQASLK